MFAVIPVIVLLMALTLAFLGSVTSGSQAVEGERVSMDANSAARAAIALAIEDIWSDFSTLTPTASAQVWDFQLFLESLGMADQSGVADPDGVDIKNRLALTADKQGRPDFAGMLVEELTAYRLDTWDSTALVVEAVVVASQGSDDSSRSRRHAVQEIFTVAPPKWEGLDYALLANNINCILCHTTIDNVDRFYNLDPTLRGTFDQVKLGSIESLHFRDDPNSSIAGSIYVGGDAMEGDGSTITDWEKFNLKSREFCEEGLLIEDQWGGMTVANLRKPDADSPDVVPNLFIGPDAKGDDSVLPPSFPSPFPDNGGFDSSTGKPFEGQAKNRVVDDAEFDSTVGGSKGTLSGGQISMVEAGKAVDDATDLSALRKGNQDSLVGRVDGHVYLHGEPNDPIVIDGEVAIDGDVIITGYVKGEGTIRARGNVYIPSDLLYADGTNGSDRTYGVAGDGTGNSLAIAAGGNVMVGDFYRPAWGEGTPTTGGKDGSFNFVMDEVAIFNRMEWIKTQPTLPGKTVKQQVGTKTVTKYEYETVYYEEEVPVYQNQKTGNKIETPVYKTVTTTTGIAPYQKTTTEKVLIGYKLVDETVKVQVGTKTVTKSKSVKTGNTYTVEEAVFANVTPQHENPYYAGEDYLARFYSFSPDKTAPIFNKAGYFDPATKHWMAAERAAAWDDTKLSYANPKNAADPFLYGLAGKKKGIVSTLTPTGGWIDWKTMQSLIHLELAERGTKNKPLEINATLYSANSIMGVVGHLPGDPTDGRLHVNGGIVAADIGLLAANGTRINYDGNAASRLSITSDQGLTIRRSASLPRPKT